MRTKGTRGLAIAGLLLAITAGCARQDAGSDAMTRTEAAADAAAGAAAPPPAPPAARERNAGPVSDDAPAAAQLDSSVLTVQDSQRRFIRTAQVGFQVRDVYESSLAIENIVAAHGGFVARNAIATEAGQVLERPMGGGKLLALAEYTVRGTLVVRVPSARTQDFLRALAAQVEFLETRTFEARDAQFELLRQQLAWQRNQSAQQGIARAVEDGGRLGQKADAISARTDAMAARDEALVAQREFEDRVAFSTIELSLHQAPRIRQSERIDTEAVFARNGPGFASRLGNALSAGWYGVLEVLLVLLRAWPLWLAILAVAWAWGRWRRK